VNDREVLDRLDEYAHSLRDRMFDRSDKKAPYAHILSRQLGRTYDRMTEVAVRMAEDRFPHTPPAPTPRTNIESVQPDVTGSLSAPDLPPPLNPSGFEYDFGPFSEDRS
jgi:hypothetical protein